MQVSEVVPFVGKTRGHYWLLQELYAFTTRLIGTIYIVIVVIVAYQFTRLRLPRSLRVSPTLWFSTPASLTGIVFAESPPEYIRTQGHDDRPLRAVTRALIGPYHDNLLVVPLSVIHRRQCRYNQTILRSSSPIPPRHARLGTLVHTIESQVLG